MSNWIAVPIALLAGWAFLASWGYRYWRNRALWLEACTKAVADAFRAEQQQEWKR
jgi:hypothetical protein